MGLIRNLTSGEIVDQVRHWQRELAARDDRVSHVVYMGMGEPLRNYGPVMASVRMLIDPELFGISPRRITVSTCGIVPKMDALAAEGLPINLAVSLHAADDAKRTALMPINARYPIAEVLAAAQEYAERSGRRVSFEYVMLDGINDSPEDARRLARLLRGVRAKVNLIPFNDWDGATFRRPPLARILAFQSILLDTELTTTVRWSKGEDIGAACGQLREPVPA